MSDLLLLLLLAAGAGLCWAIAKPRAVFVVMVREGKPAVGRGRVTEAFLAAVSEVFQEFGLQSGEIRGVIRRRRIALWFSSGVPQTARQRLRNWWALSGWGAGPGWR